MCYAGPMLSLSLGIGVRILLCVGAIWDYMSAKQWSFGRGRVSTLLLSDMGVPEGQAQVSMWGLRGKLQATWGLTA